MKNEKPIPEKIEQRLRELLTMKEFDMREVAACRAGYWQDRDGWHRLLIDCYAAAKRRLSNYPQIEDKGRRG